MFVKEIIKAIRGRPGATWVDESCDHGSCCPSNDGLGKSKGKEGKKAGERRGGKGSEEDGGFYRGGEGNGDDVTSLTSDNFSLLQPPI